LCSGVIQVGERLRIVPGDETAVVRSEWSELVVSALSNTTAINPPAIEQDVESVPYASAGQNVTLYLAAVDPINLNIGCVLCPVNDPIPLVTSFTAQILTFDLTSPIIAGTPVGSECPRVRRALAFCR
jgi:elongation factor 1 alpha-like protein